MTNFETAKWWWDRAHKLRVRTWFCVDLRAKLYIYETASKRRSPAYYIKHDTDYTADVSPNTTVAGPFKTLSAAKVAYLLIRGNYG